MAGVSTGGRRIRGLNADERQARRRTDLLTAALELFATRGYANTSIEQICQTAFVGTKSFYEIFDSKEACYLALLQDTTQQITDSVLAALEDPSDDETGATRKVITAFAHAVVDDPRVARATFGQAPGISPTIERQRRANRRWAAGFIVDLWRRYGVTDPGGGVDLERMAVGVVGGLFDLVVDWLEDGGSQSAPSIDPLVEDLTTFYELVRRGLAH